MSEQGKGTRVSEQGKGAGVNKRGMGNVVMRCPLPERRGGCANA